MILLIDNYDSFVYNLARYVVELGHEALVKRNDEMSLQEIEELAPSHIIISPGPCTPNQAGISMEVIRHFAPKLPILGICLGHQAIGQVYGGTVGRAKRPMHGKVSAVSHDGGDLFAGLESPVEVARYHSLVVGEEGFPEVLKVTARCEIGDVMGLRHREYALYGLQFHPESILTECGYTILGNFLKLPGTSPLPARLSLGEG